MSQKIFGNSNFFLFDSNGEKREKAKVKTNYKGGSLLILILREERKGELSIILLNTKWEAIHLTMKCVRKLAHLETLKAVQKKKMKRCLWQSAKQKSNHGAKLAGNQEELQRLHRKEAFEGCSLRVRTATIQLEWLLKTADATLKRGWIVTSNLILKDSMRGAL